jgi:hypothetical protein
MSASAHNCFVSQQHAQVRKDARQTADAALNLCETCQLSLQCAHTIITVCCCASQASKHSSHSSVHQCNWHSLALSRLCTDRNHFGLLVKLLLLLPRKTACYTHAVTKLVSSKLHLAPIGDQLNEAKLSVSPLLLLQLLELLSLLTPLLLLLAYRHVFSRHTLSQASTH